MHRTWSKEDRESFNKSEVMRELEGKVLDTVRRADILIQKQSASTESMNAAAEAAQNLTSSMNESSKASEQLAGAIGGNAACDEEVSEADDEVAQDALSDSAEDMVQDEVLSDLRLLAKAALEEGDLKLAYRIERTIDEIVESEIVCL